MGIEALETWTIASPSDNRWCFGFHESCWRLFLLRFGHEQDNYTQNEETILESLYYQLYCTPCLGSCVFQFGHDYGGAAQTHILSGRIKPVDLSSHLYANPCSILPLDNLEASYGQVNELANGDKISKWMDKRRPRNLIFNLPLDVKLEIFSYLSFKEVLNMRLVCRYLALFAAVDALPQSYWRSRFLLGQEADFLFPNLAKQRNWSRLFFGVRASLKTELLSLVNRKRIRQLLEPIAALVDLEPVLQKGPYGSVFQPAQNKGDVFQIIHDKNTEMPPQSIEMGDSFSGQLASIGADSPLNEGCRVLYHRTQLFMPAQKQHYRWRIGVSTVKIGAQSFISGLNLFPSGESAITDGLVGYHNPASEEWMEIPPTLQAKALYVAFSSQGLTGVKFTLTNYSSTGWVGRSSGPGIAQGILSAPEKMDQHFLIVGLDRFKIVSLGLGELTDHPGPSLMSPHQRVTNSPRAQPHLWKPYPPEHEGLEISSLLPFLPTRPFELLNNIDFGGSKGVLLGNLTRLVVHMASNPRPLIGIEVFYSGGKSVSFGSSNGCEISFFINGYKGERIDQVGILEGNREYYPETSLGGLQVFSLRILHASVCDANFTLDLNQFWTNCHFRFSSASTQRKF